MVAILVIFVMSLTFAVRVSTMEMPAHIPDNPSRMLQVQAAYDDETMYFRFQWKTDQPSWYHDIMAYEGGKWVRYPVSVGAGEDLMGLWEDSVSIMIDDGSIKGFSNFGGWLTIHEGDPRLRHFIPQSREGEWWEGHQDARLPAEELARLKEQGVFVDLWTWGAYLGNPIGYADDGHYLEWRNWDAGRGLFLSNWDSQKGMPIYMFDPEKVAFAALRKEDLVQQKYSQDDLFYLHTDFMIPFDPNYAFWDGDAIPTYVLRTPAGSREGIAGSGRWEDGLWTVQMSRALDTGYVDDKALQENRTYNVAFAVHFRAKSRFHFISYPYQMGLGVNADISAAHTGGGSPDWSTIEAQDIPIIYPGQVTWTWLTSTRHPGYQAVRENRTSIWRIHGNPEAMARIFVMLEAPVLYFRQPIIIFALLVSVVCLGFVGISILEIRRSL